MRHKYKAWDIEEKVMCGVKVISIDKGCFLIGNSPTPDSLIDRGYRIGPKDGHFVNWDKMVLRQFTGLKDQLGNDIYEGDIINHGYKSSRGTFTYKHRVFYAEDKAMFYLTRNNTQFNEGAITHNTINGKGKIFEVIGNIYENPELLP